MTPSAELIARFGADQRLYPPFRTLWCRTLDDAAREGAEFYGISGHRWPDEQTGLYLVGRDPKHLGEHAGETGFPKWGLPVTRARAYESMHNFTVAGDSSRDKDLTRRGLQPTYAIEEYEPLARHGKKNGLKSLFYADESKGEFREGPHLELDIGAKGLTLAMLRAVYKQGATPEESIRKLHDFLNAHGPWL